MVDLPFVIPTKRLIVVCLLEVAAGVYFFLRGLRLWKDRRRQRATVSKTGSVLPGLVQVNGIATGPHTISAPITGQPCYLFRTTVWQQRTTTSREWEKIAEETLHVPFFLNDSSGPLLIEPRDADLDLRSEFHKEYDSFLFHGQSEQAQSVGLFLARYGVTPTRRIRIEECCIRPESIVFIAGTVTENPGVELRPPSHRTAGAPQPGTDAPEVIRLSASGQACAGDAMTLQSKIAAALVKAGIQPNHWDAAGARAPAISLGDKPKADEAIERLPNGKLEMQQSEPESQLSPKPALVLMKGSEDSRFLISSRNRQELSRKHLWQSAVLLCGGTVLALAGLYVLLLLRRMHLL